MARRITLRSPLPPVALAERLRDSLGDEDSMPRAGVCGHGTDRDMTLFVYRPNFRNSFATSMTATMDADGAGTRIEGRIGVPTSALVFMGVWCGMIGLALFGLLFGPHSSGVNSQDGSGLVLLALMLGFGALLWTVGTWTAKADRAAILAFLADTVQAREA